MMTREELDELERLNKLGCSTTWDDVEALIAQARRAIELEEQWAREVRLQRLETGRDE